MNSPRIRFKGYTDAWEQRKLSEVADIIGGGTPSTGVAEYWDGDIDWYAPAEINDQIYVDCSERKITRLGLENSSAKILPANKTVLFTSRAGIGKTAILRHEGATNQGFQSMVLNDETNPYFVFSMSSTIKEKAERVASGSTFAEISGKMLGNLEFCFPSKAEQDKIGGYFENLDHLITLHQRKCEDTKKLKKFMLQKLFPKDGESAPEIRFEGFTDAWEQRKFGDEFKLSQGLQVPVEEQFAEQLENTEQFIRIIDVTQEGEPPRYIYNPTGKGRVKTDDIFFVRYGAVGTIGYGYNGVIANNLFKAEPLFKACNMFLFQQFSGTDFNKKLKEMSASTSMPAVNFGALNNLTFSIPSYEEQNKIGEYFGQLDNLITLHQRKLDELQKLKKFMLQSMFV